MEGKERLQEAVEAVLRRRNWSLRELAEEAGLSHATISNIRNFTRNPSPETLQKLAPVLGVDLDTLLIWAGHKPSRLAFSPLPTRSIDDIMREMEANAPVPVPVVEDITASMGPGVPVSEYQYLPPQYRRRGNSIIAIRAKGRCMEPLFHEGDYLIVDKNARWEAGDIVVAVIKGDVYAKRLAEVGGKEVLRGDADGAIIPLDGADEDEGIVGRVIYVTRPLDGVRGVTGGEER